MGKVAFKSKSASIGKSKLRFGSTLVPEAEPVADECIGVCILAESGEKITTEAGDEITTES